MAIKDLVNVENEHFWFSSWECEDFVHFSWGLVTLAIPKEGWADFSSAIAQTQLKKRSFDEMDSALVKGKRNARENNNEKGKGNPNLN